MPLNAARERSFSIDMKKADDIFKTPKALIILNDFPVALNEVKTLRLAPARGVADGQTKWVIGTKNGNSEIAAPEFTTYVGIIDGEAKSRVVLTYFNGEMIGSIERGQGEKMMLIPTEGEIGGKQPHLLAGEYASGTELFKDGFNCGDENFEDVRKVLKGQKLEQNHPLSNELLEVEVAVECDTDLFKKFGKDVGRVQRYVASVFNMVSRIYEDEINVTYHLPFVRIWTESPVDPFTAQGDIRASLYQLTEYSNQNPIDVPHNIVHMLTAPGSTGVGGIAWLGGLCNEEWGYSVSGLQGTFIYPFQGYTWDVMVIAHEIGHNFGSPHTHSCEWNPPLDTCVSQKMDVHDACSETDIKPSPGTIMSYCHLINSGGSLLTFGPRPRQVVRAGAEQCLSAPVNPTIVLQSPLGNTKILAGTTEEIRWSSARINTINIEYSTDKGVTWQKIAINIPATQRSYNWETPTEDFSEVLVRVYNPLQPTVGDTSITTFSVQNPFISLKYPQGNEKIGTNETIQISWAKDLVQRVHVEYSADGGQSWKRLATSLSVTNFTWNVADTVTNKGSVRIISAENGELIAQSGQFSVNVSRAELITPKGGEQLQKNSIYKIQWTSEFVKRLYLEYSLDNGQSWQYVRIAAVPADSGYYSWKLPDMASQTALVRISSDADRTLILAQTPMVFSIVDSIATTVENESSASRVLKIVGVKLNSDGQNSLVNFTASEGMSIDVSLVSTLGISQYVLKGIPARNGENMLSFKTGDLAQGMYILVLKSGKNEATIPVTLIR